MEIFQIWSEVSFNPSVTSIDHYLSSSLWHNSLIKIDNRPVFFYKSWYAKGVTIVAHLMKDSTTFISYWHKFDKLLSVSNQIFLLFKALRWYYSAFHKIFNKRFLKFIWNSWSLLQTWRFHYVIVIQIVNLEIKLWILRRTSLGS